MLGLEQKTCIEESCDSTDGWRGSRKKLCRSREERGWHRAKETGGASRAVGVKPGRVWDQRAKWTR